MRALVGSCLGFGYETIHFAGPSLFCDIAAFTNKPFNGTTQPRHSCFGVGPIIEFGHCLDVFSVTFHIRDGIAPVGSHFEFGWKNAVTVRFDGSSSFFSN